ncbi:helix-turn-helix domain-containing protein [Variovorax sp. W2I14]|uniref:helix-turn-helix domain-containing protein n=1 Tax=Variovorax sp. W2I14 TaxID=3042290 RepID=UPI003D1F6BF9
MAGDFEVDAIAMDRGFSERLKNLVAAEGRGCKAELARHCGVTRPAITHWLSGRNKGVEATCLFAIADYFNVDPRWLAVGTGSEWPVPPMERKVHPPIGEVLSKIEEVASRCRHITHEERVGIYMWLTGESCCCASSSESA